MLFNQIIALFFILSPAELATAKSKVQQDYESNLKIEKKYLNRRYEGFYNHVKRYKNYQNQRRKKVLQHKEKRRAHEVQREEVRRSYKARKAKQKRKQVDIDALMAKVEKERAKKRKVIRNKFIKRREIMESLKRTTKKIPEDLDVGLKAID